MRVRELDVAGGCSRVMRTFSRQGAAKSSICCRPDAFSSVVSVTAGQVRDHYRIPVILGRRGPHTYQPRRDHAAPRRPRRRRAVPSPAHEPRTSAGVDRPLRPGPPRWTARPESGRRSSRRPLAAGRHHCCTPRADRSGQDPDHNHQDPVTTVHPPGGEPGSVAKARTAARGRASDLAHDSPMASGRRRTARRRTPLNAVAFTGRTEIVMSEARSAESRCRWRR